MLFHRQIFKAYLLYNCWKGHQLLTTLKEDDVLDMKETKFTNYFGSAYYLAYVADSCSQLVAKTIMTMEAIECEVDTTIN
jgi:hypothetical protein